LQESGKCCIFAEKKIFMATNIYNYGIIYLTIPGGEITLQSSAPTVPSTPTIPSEKSAPSAPSASSTPTVPSAPSAPSTPSVNAEENKIAWSEKDQANKSKREKEEILGVPEKGNYGQVRRYIKERCRFDDEFRQYVSSHSRVALCIRLTDEFGWDVDEHSLGVNMNRNR
jgi:hypothetical protein